MADCLSAKYYLQVIDYIELFSEKSFSTIKTTINPT